MPQNLTGNPASFPTQTAPASGEARTAAAFATPLQNSADRTAYLKDRLDYVDPTKEGARRIRRVTSIAALRALTDLSDRIFCAVDGVGLYAYDQSSTLTAVEPFVVTPTIVGVGAGRWVWEAYGSLNVANGVPQLDASGLVPTSLLAAKNAFASGSRIDPSNVKNGPIDVQTVTAAGPHSTSSSTYVDVGSIAIAFTLKTGDKVLIDAKGTKSIGTSGVSHYTQWQVTKPDTSTATVSCSETRDTAAAASQYATASLAAVYTAAADGVHTFKLQQKSSTGDSVALADVSVGATQVRA